MLSMLPPLLLVVMLSVEEYLFLLIILSFILLGTMSKLGLGLLLISVTLSYKNTFEMRSLLFHIILTISPVCSLEFPGRPLNSEMCGFELEVLPNSISKALPCRFCKEPLAMPGDRLLKVFTGKCRSFRRVLKGRFGALLILFIINSFPGNFDGRGAVDGGDGVYPHNNKPPGEEEVSSLTRCMF